MKKNSEYEAFDGTMRDLLKVPHSAIRERIEEEKAAKKRKKSKTSSASREATAKV